MARGSGEVSCVEVRKLDVGNFRIDSHLMWGRTRALSQCQDFTVSNN